jgi:hypothetical protein
MKLAILAVLLGLGLSGCGSGDDGGGCCRTCTTGCPCGDSCIACTSTCSRGPGCACSGLAAGLSVDGGR